MQEQDPKKKKPRKRKPIKLIKPLIKEMPPLIKTGKPAKLED